MTCVLESGLLSAAMTAHELHEEGDASPYLRYESADPPLRPQTCRWTLENSLQDRAYSVDELRGLTGFSHYTLTQCLKKLAKEGVATRSLIVEKPRRYGSRGPLKEVNYWTVRRAVVGCALADCMRTQLGA